MPQRKPIAGWAVALLATLFGAAILLLIGILSARHSLRTAAFLALAGGLLGAMSAPDFRPAAFSRPKLWQMLCATLFGLAIALQVSAPPIGYALAVLVSAPLGYCAHYWSDSLVLPWRRSPNKSLERTREG